MNTPSSYSYQNYLQSQAEGVHLGHIIEFSELCRRIVLEQIYEIVPPMVEEICFKVVKDYLSGNLSNSISYDIHSIADVSIKDFSSMFHSEAFSQFMSDAIGKEIQKRIGEIEIKIV